MNKPKNLEELQTTMNKIITVKKHKILAQKPIEAQYLNYTDFNDLCDTVKTSYCELMQVTETPRAISVACYMSLAIIAPSNTERKKMIKLAKAGATGLAGIGAIIGGIAMAMGWGMGVTELIIAFFVGAPVLGPIGIVLAGLGLAGIAAYFAYQAKDPRGISDKAEAALRESIRKALVELWEIQDFEL